MLSPPIPQRKHDFSEGAMRFWWREMVVVRYRHDKELESYEIKVSDEGYLYAIATPRGSFWNMTLEANKEYRHWEAEQHRLLNSLITGEQDGQR